MWSLSVQFKRLRLIVALIINHFWNRTGQILTIANNSAAFWLYLLFGMILVCFCPQTHWLTSPDKNKSPWLKQKWQKKTYWFPESPYRRMLNGSAFATRDSERYIHLQQRLNFYHFLCCFFLFFVKLFCLQKDLYKCRFLCYTRWYFYIQSANDFFRNYIPSSRREGLGRNRGKFAFLGWKCRQILCILRLNVPSDNLHPMLKKPYAQALYNRLMKCRVLSQF